ncbi:MAG TPA: ferritin family protein [Thermoanaerobaculia bacterium]|nr:ferritin family protein [Thermoanaerobaculia bacterium]HUM31228.1 ferritin family protein [Thermoanaerobaculia bacterium]HXK69582.1 ferritin family protein [Thermoanaerobaculia bacterium]
MNTFESMLDVILTAIHAEKDAASFYLAMGDKIKSPVLKDGFRILAREEELHLSILKEIYLDIPGQSKNREFGTSSYTPAEFPPFTGGSLREILEYALEREYEAIHLYTSLSRQGQNQEAMNTFLRLVSMEEWHVHYLKRSLSHIEQFAHPS